MQRGKVMFDWLVDDENRELIDEIENVNYLMLDKLISTSESLAVLFCKYFEHSIPRMLRFVGNRHSEQSGTFQRSHSLLVVFYLLNQTINP